MKKWNIEAVQSVVFRSMLISMEHEALSFFWPAKQSRVIDPLQLHNDCGFVYCS